MNRNVKAEHRRHARKLAAALVEWHIKNVERLGRKRKAKR